MDRAPPVLAALYTELATRRSADCSNFRRVRGEAHVWHQFAVRIARRVRGATGEALPRRAGYRHARVLPAAPAPAALFPVSRRRPATCRGGGGGAEVLCLPIYPSLGDDATCRGVRSAGRAAGRPDEGPPADGRGDGVRSLLRCRRGRRRPLDRGHGRVATGSCDSDHRSVGEWRSAPFSAATTPPAWLAQLEELLAHPCR